MHLLKMRKRYLKDIIYTRAAINQARRDVLPDRLLDGSREWDCAEESGMSLLTDAESDSVPEGPLSLCRTFARTCFSWACLTSSLSDSCRPGC